MTIRDHASRRAVGVLDDDWDRIEAVLWVPGRPWPTRSGRSEGKRRGRRPDRAGGARPAATALQARSPTMNSSRDDRDHGRHRGGQGGPEQQQQGGLAHPGPGGDDQQQRAAGEGDRERAGALEPQQRPASAPSWRASRYT